MTRHQYEISGFVPRASFRGKTSDGFAKWRLFSQDNELHNLSLKNSHGFVLFTKRAKKVVSDSPGLVDFAFGLVNFVLNLPDGPVKFFEEGIVKSILTIKTFLGLAEMTFGLVNASFCFPEWQAVKLTFFALCLERGSL